MSYLAGSVNVELAYQLIIQQMVGEIITILFAKCPEMGFNWLSAWFYFKSMPLKDS